MRTRQSAASLFLADAENDHQHRRYFDLIAAAVSGNGAKPAADELGVSTKQKGYL
jgi:hypothetical protein